MIIHRRSRKIFWLFRIILVFFATLLTFVLGELIFRHFLFSELSFMDSLRNPRLYTSGIASDYYRLQHLFRKTCAPPSDLTLGWINKNLIYLPNCHHRDETFVGSRIPVLLYGDSFAQCVTSEDDCFQGILNRNSFFKNKYYLINYGVIGYGIDQTYLLYQKTVGHFISPLVIIGLLDRDMERCMSSSTWGLKPYFTLQSNDLKYHGEHLTTNVQDFFKNNPPEILSYLYRLIIFSPIMPEPLSDWLGSVKDQKSKLKRLNKAIILKLAADLKSRNLKHIFLVFEWAENIAEPPGWRIEFLVKLFKENHIDFILARDIIRAQEKNGSFDWQKYALSSEWNHPNAGYNELISARILDWIRQIDQSQNIRPDASK